MRLVITQMNIAHNDNSSDQRDLQCYVHNDRKHQQMTQLTRRSQLLHELCDEFQHKEFFISSNTKV